MSNTLLNRFLLFGFFLFVLQHSYSQTNEVNHYTSGIRAETLKQHLDIIASDEMEGRETGQEGQRKAAAYIESQFKALGLTSPAGLLGYQQFYPFVYDSLIKATLKIRTNQLDYGNDFVVPIEKNKTSQGGATSIVFAGYGIDHPAYSDYDSLDVRGKAVLIMSGEPLFGKRSLITGKNEVSEWTYRIEKKQKAALARGAVALLVVDLQYEERKLLINSIKTPPTFTPDDVNNKEADVFTAYVSKNVFLQLWGEEANHRIDLAAQARSLRGFSLEKKVPILISFEKKRIDLAPSNVIGLVEGSDKKDEYVIITAHYDHLGKRENVVYNGADDDGSGTCAVIAMAEAFVRAKREGRGPRRTIVFMTVSGEEKGLWGSNFYTENPLFSLAKTSVNLNIDMIGRIDTERTKSDTLNYLYIVGQNKISGELAPLHKQVNQKCCGLSLDYTFDDPQDPNRIFYRSDHYNFAKKGVPALFFYDGMLEADYHQPEDDVDKINWPLYEKRTRFIFSIAWEIANRDRLLIRNIPLDQKRR